MYIEGWAFDDSLTMTIHTITTLGLKEIQPLSYWGLQFTNLLVIVGVIILMYSLGVVGEVVLSGQLESLLGRRKDHNMLKDLKNHYIVCGYGRMGRVVTQELLSHNEKVLVIERKPELLEILRQKEIPYLSGEATSDDLLEKAKIAEATGLISTVGHDTENVYIVISARELNPQLKIIALSDDPRAYSKLKQAGANKVINPFEIGGIRLALTLVKPTVSQFMESVMGDGGDHNIQLDEILVTHSHPWKGKTIKEIPPRDESRINILGIKKANGEMIHFPPSGTTLEEGDTLVALGLGSE